MTTTIQTRRRNFFVIVAAIVLSAVVLFTAPPLDTDRFKHIIPGQSSDIIAPIDDAVTTSTTSPSSRPTVFRPKASDKSGPAPSETPNPSQSSESSKHKTGKITTSKFHYLIPASNPNVRLCYNLLSSAATRYPVPMILGYNGTGEFDAAITHLAKLRSIKRHLDSLKKSEDDDLVMIVDGYDVIQQLPPEVVIERYFEIAGREDKRTATRFGITPEQVRKENLHTTVFFGPDKVCWPIDYRQARCWAVPSSNLPEDAFGPLSGTGEMYLNDPRWLNSGTIIGPVSDVRDLFHAVMQEVEATYDEEYEFKESDQYYLSNVWGRQEYFRSKKAFKGGEVPDGPDDRIIPTKATKNQVTEFHVGIEYESALFQTRAGNEPWHGWMQFKHVGLAAEMNLDLFGQNESFKPYQIQMPPNVVSALTKLYDAIPDAHPGVTTAEWIRNTNLMTNYITRHIFTLWHVTGPKEFVGWEFPNFWFYPYAKSLLKASVQALQGEKVLISNQIVDGRRWAPKLVYPDPKDLVSEFGGAYTDFNGGEFVDWNTLCGEHNEELFRGETGVQPPSTEVPQASVTAEAPAGVASGAPAPEPPIPGAPVPEPPAPAPLASELPVPEPAVPAPVPPAPAAPAPVAPEPVVPEPAPESAFPVPEKSEMARRRERRWR